MAEQVADRCVLLRAFAEFELLPDLLAMALDSSGEVDAIGEVVERWAAYLERIRANLDHVEADEFSYGPGQYRDLAWDLWDFVERMGWVEGFRLSNLARHIAAIAELPIDARTVQDTWFLERAIGGSVRRHYLGADGRRVVDLLQDAAARPAQAENGWIRSVPGLLLVEFEALIYWAFRDPGYAAELPGRLVPLREEARDTYMDPAPVPKDQVMYQTVVVADAVAALYVETEGLAMDTGLTVTALRSTAMLLTFGGLLREHALSPVSYLMPPEAGDE